MSETEREEQLTPDLTLPVDWHVPDDMISLYANNVFVQQGQYEFIISFFEARLPLLAGTSEENRAKLAQLESIRAECVARIVVSPELIQRIIDALQTTLDTYRATQGKE